MSLTPRLIAIQGIGFSAIELAVQGLLESAAAFQPRPVIASFVSGGRGGGPDANLSLSNYLKKFGLATATPARSVPAQSSAQHAALARKKRHRMEEELLLLVEI
jgi:NAD(P)H-dependent FMN reductase